MRHNQSFHQCALCLPPVCFSTPTCRPHKRFLPSSLQSSQILSLSFEPTTLEQFCGYKTWLQVDCRLAAGEASTAHGHAPGLAHSNSSTSWFRRLSRNRAEAACMVNITYSSNSRTVMKEWIYCFVAREVIFLFNLMLACEPVATEARKYFCLKEGL